MSWRPLLMLGPALWLQAALAAESAPGRDPMQPPPELRMPLDPNSGADGAELPQPRQLIIIDGKPLLVLGSRRYAVGERIGGARIERITEQAVWLRDAAGVHRLPLFAGVDKVVGAPSRSSSGARPAPLNKQNRDPS